MITYLFTILLHTFPENIGKLIFKLLIVVFKESGIMDNFYYFLKHVFIFYKIILCVVIDK